MARRALPPARVKDGGMRIRFLLGAICLSLLASSAAANTVSIEISKSEKTLNLMRGEDVLASYDVAVGSDEHPTPIGSFSIRKLIWNPGWVPPPVRWAKKKKPTPPGHPDNPMKRVKMFFKEPDYYIHGSAADVANSESHGCIRMRPDEVTELAKAVMEHGGKSMPEPWYRRVLVSRKSKWVTLTDPIEVVITE